MAKRFQFRLQTLLEVRRIHEREAKRRVAEKNAEIARLDTTNAQTADEITRQQDALLRAQQAGALDPIALQRGRAWVAHLRKQIAMRQMQKIGLQEQLRELQEKLREARTQTRIIEKLRERRWDEHRKDREKREQSLADEMAQILHGRQQADADAEALASVGGDERS